MMPSNPSLYTLLVALLLLQPALTADELVPLPKPSVDGAPSMELVELGKILFFDPKLSGDATISCASCHDPAKAFTDGLQLSKGYPGTLYFRNTPTLINASSQSLFYWDGRMSGDDLASLIRDHIAEAHFFQADGRLIIERLRQVPEYSTRFPLAAGGEPSYGKILNALAAFVGTLRSAGAPIDRYLAGDDSALNDSAKRGLGLFRGKADCIRCHNGPLLSDGKHHNTGVPNNPNVFAEPERHITFRRFMRTIGVGDCASLRSDIGYGCVTKEDVDRGKFRTPSLREVSRTAPYMHNGMLPSLADVVRFYNAGGGNSAGKDQDLKPLDLTDEEQSDLVEFLKTLAGEPHKIQPVKPPEYGIRELGAF